MPSLKFIIGGDASPFAKAMGIVATAGTAAGQRTMQEFKKAAAVIEETRANIIAMGGSTKFVDAALVTVNSQMFQLEQKTMAAKMAADALAQSYAKVKLGLGDEADRRAVMLSEATRTPDKDAVQRGKAKRALRQQGVSEYEEKLAAKAAGAEEYAAKKAKDAHAAKEAAIAAGMDKRAARLAMVAEYEERLARKAAGAAEYAEKQKLAWRDRTATMRAGQTQSFVTGNNSTLARPRASFGVASSMFVSVARDSAASLASGAPITQVIAQQAPQVLQALTMMRLGMVAVGISAAAVGAVIAFKIVKGLYDAHVGTERVLEGFRRVKAMTETLEMKISEKLTAKINELDSKLKAINRARQEGNNALSSGDAQAELEKEFLLTEFSNKKVKSKEEELELQKQLLAIDLKRAFAAQEAAKKAMDESEPVAKAALQLEQLNQEYDQKKKQFDTLESGMLRREANPATGKVWTTDEWRAESRRWGGESSSLVRSISETEKDLESARNMSGQGEVDRATANIIRIQRKIDEAKLDPEKIKKSSGGGGYSMELTSNQRIGAYAGGPQLNLLDVANKQLTTQQQILEAVRAAKSPGFASKPGGMATN
jgi:hypothetical protein